MGKTLLNLAIFQLGWLVCLVGGNYYAIAFTGTALLIHHFYVLGNHSEWRLIAIIVSVGLLWDLLMIQTGIIVYADDDLLGLPLWLICLWLLFATTFSHCLYWMRQYLWVAAIFAAVFAPASYWLGSRLVEARFGEPLLLSLAVMATGWAILFPSGIYLAGRYKS